MYDRVAEVLAQRERRPAGTVAGVVIVTSLLLHTGVGYVVYRTQRKRPQLVSMVSIRLAPASAPPAAAPPRRAPAVPAPVVEAPKPEPQKIEEPKIVEPAPQPPPQQPVKPPEKNTVPFSPFGRSTKKGSEAPAVTPPAATPPGVPSTDTAPGIDVPTGGTGIAGIEGGDFPHTIYITAMQRKIGASWYRPQTAATGTAVVIYFRIHRDGRVTDVRVATSSGNPTFDRAALSAVQSSSPFNPLPFAYQGTYIGINLVFK